MTVHDRLMTSTILPDKGSFSTLRSIEAARKEISLSDAEVKEFEFQTVVDGNSSRMTWNEKGNEAKAIEIGEMAFEEIKKKLKQMDEKGELTNDHLHIYEIFVGS